MAPQSPFTVVLCAGVACWVDEMIRKVSLMGGISAPPKGVTRPI
jgi:hypothetical protein